MAQKRKLSRTEKKKARGKGGLGTFFIYKIYFSSWRFAAAETKPRKSGCGRFGLLLNSG